jgi:O-antigen/teichoic acid export membrane protein
MSALLVPSILILTFAGQFILNVFGKNYASGGIYFLRYVAAAAVTVSAYNLFNILFSVKKDLYSIMLINLIFAVSTIILSYLLLSFGLAGIGLAWLAGNGLAGLIGFYIYHKKFHPSYR